MLRVSPNIYWQTINLSTVRGFPYSLYHNTYTFNMSVYIRPFVDSVEKKPSARLFSVSIRFIYEFCISYNGLAKADITVWLFYAVWISNLFFCISININCDCDRKYLDRAEVSSCRLNRKTGFDFISFKEACIVLSFYIWEALKC